MIQQELLGAMPLKSFLKEKPFKVFFRKFEFNEGRHANCDLKQRKRWCDLKGKWHRLKGTGQKSNPNTHLVTFDRRKRNYITIPIRNLKFIKQGSKRYLVETNVNPSKKALPLFDTVTLTPMP